MTDIIHALYVDDEQDLLEIGKLYLEAGGKFAIDTVTSAHEGLEKLKTEPYDVIISDYQMPDMDGIAFLKKVRRSKKNIPFIIFTGKGREEIAIEAFENGADFYLQKGGEPKSQFADLSNKIRKAVEHRRADIQVTSLNRLYGVLSASNKAIVRIHHKPELLEEICRIIVDIGGFRMAWAGMANPEKHFIEPFAASGYIDGYLDSIAISTDDVFQGRGPTGTAYREKTYNICNDVANDLNMAPWREEALKRGYRSVAAFPIAPDTRNSGVITVYASEPGSFTPQIIRLLDEQSEDVTFAFVTLDYEEQRISAENDLKQSELKYRRLFETAQDAILILDGDNGKVMDANKFILDMLGYPLEYFIGMQLWELGFMRDRAIAQKAFNELKTTGYIRYDDIPLERIDGRSMNVEFISNVYLVGDKRIIQCNIRDNTERQLNDKRQALTLALLQVLNRFSYEEDSIRKILHVIRESIGIEAIGIRLKNGEDYPYPETSGFPDPFVESGQSLCGHDNAGDLRRDEQGQVTLECICGSIISGRTDTRYQFFTKGGSFWSNGTTDLLASTTEQERQVTTRNRCNGEGYGSVALIPLRSHEKTIGLIQLNDRRKNMFSLEMIQFFEGLGNTIGIALERKYVELELVSAVEHIKEVHKLAHIGTWDWDMETDTVTWSDELFKIAGRDPSQPAPTYAEHPQVYTPDSWDRLSGAVSKARSTGEPYNLELKLVRPDGCIRVVNAFGTVKQDGQDKVVGLHGTVQDITDQKMAQEALMASELRYRRLFETAQDAILILDGTTGEVIDANRFIIDMLGYPLEYFVGKYLWELGFIKDKSLAEKAFTELKTNGYIRYEDIPLETKDGRSMNVESISNVYLVGGKRIIQCDIRDNNEKKVFQEAVQASETRYRRLFETTQDGILILDEAKGTIIDANKFIIDMLGYPLEYFLGKHLWELGFIKDKSIAQNAFSELKANNYIRYEDIPLETKDGVSMNVEFISNVYLVGGKRIIQSNIRDITARKRAEGALGLTTRKLHLLSSITRHDINNQLTVQMGYLELLQSSRLDPSQSEYFQKVTNAAERISTMLRFTKEYENIGVTAAVWQDCHTLVDIATKEAPLGQVMVINDLPAGAEVFADPLIVKVFYNLIDNAVRYGGKITTIRIFFSEHNDDRAIVCEDNGVGIPAEEKEKIFEWGFGKNTGMGLILAREILSITGITIRETGDPGKGARFEMTVPGVALRMTGDDIS